jgi:hypothetical protein
MLVMAGLRLRLTAYSLAGLRDRGGSTYPDAPAHVDEGRARLRHLAADLDEFYQRIAVQVGRPVRGAPPPAEVQIDADIEGAARPGGDGRLRVHHHPHALWVHEHLHHLALHVAVVPEPALHVAELRRSPWWR